MLPNWFNDRAVHAKKSQIAGSFGALLQSTALAPLNRRGSMAPSMRFQLPWRGVSELGLVILVAMLSASSRPAMAQEWDGSESSNWFAGGNWVGGVVPDGLDDVDIATPLPGTNLVLISDFDTYGAATGRILSVGDGGEGAIVTIQDGGVFSSVIDDTISTNINIWYDSYLFVSRVNFENTVDRRSSLLSGSGLYVGREGGGNLHVTDGGYVEVGRLASTGVSPQGVLIGMNEDSTGTVLVTGVNRKGDTDYRSTLVSRNDISVGVGITGEAEGNLFIIDGGLVTVADKLSIADTEDATGNVFVWGIDDDGDTSYRSTLSVATSLSIGGADFTSGPTDGGLAVMSVADGGLVEVGGGAGQINLGLGVASDATLVIGNELGDDDIVDPGLISAASINFGNGMGSLVFDHADETGTYVFDPDLISDGIGDHYVTHLAGYTVFGGDNSAFTGETYVQGGTLGGTFTIGGDLFLQQEGILSPGNSIGTIGIAGDFVTDSDGTLMIEVDQTGASDLVDVAGIADLNGGTVYVSGMPLAAYDYTFLTAVGGVNGTFDELDGIEDTLFVDYYLDYDANNVYLTSDVLSGFCDVAGTFNQQSVACDGLDSLPTDNEVVQAVLASSSVEEARAAYDALSGEVHPSLKGALMDNGQKRVQAVNRHMHSAFDFSGGQAPDGTSAEVEDHFWMTGVGSWSETEATGNTARMDDDLLALIIGFDREVSEHWRFGALGGYGVADIAQNDRSSTGSANTWSAGLYGGFKDDAAAVSFGGIFNWHDIETARTPEFTYFSETLTASYDAKSWQFFAEGGVEVQMDRMTLEPFAGVSYVGLDTKGFAETGGSAALVAASDRQDTTFTTLGMRSALEIAELIRTKGMLGWRHAFGDTDPSSVFTLSDSDQFTVYGAPVAEDALIVEIGLQANLTANAFFGVDYAGQYGDGAAAHGFNASFKSRF